MPELPEVECFTRDLARWTGGAILERVDVPDPRVLSGVEPGGLEILRGGRPGRCWRRAKWSVVEVQPRGAAPTQALLLHYRMTGKPVLEDGAPGRKVRLRLHLRPGGEAGASRVDEPERVVAFDDSRCLGEVHLLPLADLPAFFEARRLGPDCWPERRPGSWWAERLGDSRRPLKVALLDQHRVAGVGNIGASEACFRARLDPRGPARSLPDAAWEALAEAVPAWVEATLAEELGQEIHFVTAGGSNPFLVYGREGEPCAACGDPVARFVQAQRSTFWCPSCQGG